MEFHLVLGKQNTYKDLAKKVGEKLGYNELSNLRFFNSHQGKPTTVIKPEEDWKTVAEMIWSADPHASNNVLFYESLDMSIGAIGAERTVKVTWNGTRDQEVVCSPRSFE